MACSPYMLLTMTMTLAIRKRLQTLQTCNSNQPVSAFSIKPTLLNSSIAMVIIRDELYPDHDHWVVHNYEDAKAPARWLQPQLLLQAGKVAVGVYMGCKLYGNLAHMRASAAVAKQRTCQSPSERAAAGREAGQLAGQSTENRAAAETQPQGSGVCSARQRGCQIATATATAALTLYCWPVSMLVGAWCAGFRAARA